MPALLAAQEALAQPDTTDSPAIIGVGQPAEFANLTAPQEALVDVYFGDRKLGETRVMFKPDALTFLDPEGVISLLPKLSDAAAVKLALSAPGLPTHSNLVCTLGADPKVCGRLAPAVAGIIFNQDRFRVDVFVNPRMLVAKEAVSEEYLPAPEGGLSLINGIGGVLSGAVGESPIYDFHDRLILSSGDKRLVSDLSYASDFGLQADRLVVEIDRPGWRYSAGAFWAPGTDLVGRRKMIGLGIETQIDTRLDKDTIRGTPLTVFLNQRARVEILRDGRVLASRIYEAGNQSLDTSMLPDGSYEVVLRIDDFGGGQRDERRFFTKNRNIASIGQDVFFAYAGVLSDDSSHNFLSPTGTPFFEGGAARRLGPNFAIDGTVLATDQTVLGQAGGYYITSQAQVRLAALASSSGAYGAILQINSQGDTRLNYNFDLRHIEADNQQPDFVFAQMVAPHAELSNSLSQAAPSALPLANSTFTQISGNISYSLPSVQLNVNGSVRRDEDQGTSYYVGPSARWEVLRQRSLRVWLNADGVVSDQGNSWFLGVSLRLLGRRSSFGDTAGMRSTASGSEPRQAGAVGSIDGSWRHDDVAGAQLDLGGSYEHDLDRDLASGTAELRGRTISLAGQAAKGIGNDAGPMQYSLGFNTSFAITDSTVAFEGRNQSDGMVVVNLDGKKSDDRFEVIVDNQSAGTVKIGDKLAIPLPAYRQYEVRVRPLGSNLVDYDGSVRRIGLYPGNTAELSWSVTPLVAMFGRLVFEGGVPIRYGSISAAGSVSETNEAGYFEIETAEGSTLDVKLQDGRSCHIPLPATAQKNGYATLGTLTCRTKRQEFGLNSGSSLPQATESRRPM